MTKKKPGIKTGRPARHGGFSFLTRGVLPEKRGYLRHYLTAIRENLVKDIAINEEGLTTAQRILVDRTVTFLGVIRLIEEWVREHGVLDEKGGLSPSLSAHYLAFNRNVKEYLVLLGIDRRRPDDVLDLGRYLETKAQVEKDAASNKGVEQIGAVAPSGKAVSGSRGEDLKNDAFSGDGPEAGSGEIGQPARPGGEIRGADADSQAENDGAAVEDSGPGDEVKP